MAVGSAFGLAGTRLLEPVEGVHRAVFGRVRSIIGPVMTPIAAMHDVVSKTVYFSIRTGMRAVALALDATPLASSPLAENVAGAVTGIWGDDLGPFGSRLAADMHFKQRSGAPVGVVELGRIMEASASRRLVVLVHGWSETDRCWGDADDEPGLFGRLAQSDGSTPIAIRFNSGLRVSDNGAQLADLLEALHQAVDIGEVVLVGHSMGGLVARAALWAAQERSHAWPALPIGLITLGTPHHGAPVERAVNAAAWALARVSELEPIGAHLNRRSGGAKDMRYGAVAVTDWEGFDPDALLDDTVQPRPIPAHVRSAFVAGTITRDPKHPVGMAAGDLVVPSGSATGGRKVSAMEQTVIGGVHHLDLLRDARVLDWVMAWIEARDDGSGRAANT